MVTESGTPLVSIIMNCYNGARYLQDAIDSVYAQTSPDWEIIFFDNASTDASASIARSYDSRLRYFKTDSTITLGAARNSALAYARGEYVAFLDSDDLWLPDKLVRQVQLLNETPRATLAYGNFYFLSGPAWERNLAYRRPQPAGSVFRRFLKQYPVNLQTVMIRRGSLARLTDVFDERLCLAEEYDVFMRLLMSTEAVYDHTPLAAYRVHDAMNSVKQAALYPEEMIYVLGKLRALDPSFDRQYASEVAYIEAKIGYWTARAAMLRGDRHAARAAMWPYRMVSGIFAALYVATYCPRLLWNPIHHPRLRALLRG